MKVRICGLLAMAAFIPCFLASAQPLAQNANMKRVCESMQREYDKCSEMAAKLCNSELEQQTDPYVRRMLERRPPCSSLPECETFISDMWQMGCPQ